MNYVYIFLEKTLRPSIKFILEWKLDMYQIERLITKLFLDLT